MSDTVNDPEEPLDPPPDGQSGGSGTEADLNLDPVSTDPQLMPLDPPEGQGGGG
jgi:hypothetical protein